MSFILDLGDSHLASKSLQEFLQLNEQEIECLSNTYALKDDGFKALKTLSIDINSLLPKFEETKLVMYHITSSIDQCTNLAEEGLKNTNSLLQSDNPFTSFLRKHNIAIDLDERILNVDKENYELKYIENNNNDTLEKKISNLYFKVYREYHICGFFTKNQNLDYSHVKNYPEILASIEEVCLYLERPKKLSSDWIEISEGSIEVRVEEDIRNFSMDKFCGNDCVSSSFDNLTDDEKNSVIIRIIEFALSTILSDNNSYDGDLLLGYNVPPENITLFRD